MRREERLNRTASMHQDVNKMSTVNANSEPSRDSHAERRCLKGHACEALESIALSCCCCCGHQDAHGGTPVAGSCSNDATVDSRIIPAMRGHLAASCCSSCEEGAEPRQFMLTQPANAGTCQRSSTTTATAKCEMK